MKNKMNKPALKKAWFSIFLLTSLKTGNAPFSSLENTSLPFTVTSNEAVTKKRTTS